MDSRITIYARPNNGVIERFFSSVSEQPLETDIVVEKGYNDYHAYPQLKYQVLDANRCHNYKDIGGAIALRTDEEKAAELASRPPAPPTEKELMQKQIDDLALLFLERERVINV